LFIGLAALAGGESLGTISGTVFDAAGDPSPLAKVSALETQSGARRDVIADDYGSYRISGLGPGSYRLIVSSVLSGTWEAKVTLREGQSLNVPLALTISRESGPVPRDHSDVTTGQEGGDIEGYGPYGSRGSSSFNSYGQRGQQNNFLFDGIDNNQNWVRGAALMPPSEAIASVNLSSGYIPAEFGHATGAVVNVASRSGGSALHGSAFERLGNSALDARNFFDGSKPGLVSDWFGASAGGPAGTRGLFYFGDFEVLRDRQDLTVISTVPTVAQKAGDFSGLSPIYDPTTIRTVGENVFTRQPFLNNSIPLTRIPVPSQRLLATYPNPNLPGFADNYRFNPSSIQNSQRFDVRVDKAVSARHSAFLRLTNEGSSGVSPGAFPGGFGSDIEQHADGDRTNTNAWGGAISEVFTIRPSLLNSFRAGAQGIDLHARAGDQGVNSSALLGIPGLGADGLPSVEPTGFTALGATGPVPLQIRSASYQVEDSVAWTSSRQAIKFGVQAIRQHVDGDASAFTDRGTFSFTPDYTSQPGATGATGDSIASLLLGFPSEERRDIQLSPYQLRGWELAAFAQDQIRVSGRLTIVVGVRYSMDPPVTEAENRMVNFNFSSTAPDLDRFAGKAGVNRSGGLTFNRKAFGPRLGFALNLSGNGTTVLRGAFSKAFDDEDYRAEGALAQNAPFASRLDLVNGTFQLGPNLTAGLPAPSTLNPGPLNGAAGPIYAIQPQPFTPYTDQWNLFLQRRLKPGLVLESGIESSMGVHLYAAYDANQPYPAPSPYATPRYPFEPYESRVDYLGMGGGSTYYGGVLRLTGRVARGLDVVLGYTYGKSIDDAIAPDTDPESRPAGPQDIYGHRGNRGLSTFDIEQRAVLTAHYELPRDLPRFAANWRVDTIVTLQGGLPFTPVLATNSLNNGGFQLPNRVGFGDLASQQRSYLDWFNSGIGPGVANHAFEMPALYQYGNSGFSILRGPGLATTDVEFSRTFAMGDRCHLQPRVEALNLLNRTNLALPEAVLGVESSGVISHTATPARQVRLAMAVTW
jgi:hypothetical protein